MAKEKSEPVHKKMIKVQKVSRQENKAITASKRCLLLRVAEAGFLQSLIISWHGDSIVSNINFHLDLGKHGSFHVNSIEYFEAGIVSPHSAQDFWVSKKDDTAHKYAIALTPEIPIEFDELRLVMTNKNNDALTVNLAQIKFYTEILEKNET